MATQLLTGTIELMAVSDGSQLEIRMGTSGNRTQYYDDAGNHFPDYEANGQENSRPKFWPVVTDTNNNSILAINIGSGVWKYNGATIQWGDANNGVQTSTGDFAGMFQQDQYEVSSGVYVPRLTVVKNLGSTTNDDSDTIEFSGAVNLSGGVPFSITVSSYINISRLAAGNADAISIYALDGQEFDYDNSTSDNLRFQPYIIAGGAEKGNNVPNGYSLKVSGVGIYSGTYNSSTDKWTIGTTALNKTVAGGTNNYIETINQDMINDEAILVFELQKDGVTVSSAAIQLYDNGDPDNVTLNATATKDGVTRNVTRDVRDGESVTINCVISDRATGAIKNPVGNTEYNYVWYVLNHAGTTAINLSTTPSATAKARSMNVTYEQIRSNGGIFVACSTSKSRSANDIVAEVMERRKDDAVLNLSYFGLS